MRTRIGLALLVAALAVAAHSGRAQEKEDAKAQVAPAGLRVVAAVPGEDESLHPFFEDPGTTVALLVRLPGFSILGIDPSGSLVTRCVEDSGRDLLEDPYFEEDVGIARDASAMVVNARTNKIPSPGARKLHLEGKLSVRTAKGTESRTAPFALAVGSKIEEAGLVLERIDDSTDRRSPVHLDFKASRPGDEIAALTFKDAQGAVIRARRIGHGGSFQDKDWYTIWGIERRFDKGTVTVELRTGVETRVVSLAVDVTLGL